MKYVVLKEETKWVENEKGVIKFDRFEVTEAVFAEASAAEKYAILLRRKTGKNHRISERDDL